MSNDINYHDILAEIAAFFRRRTDVALVFVFGSAASRTMTEGSDIDVAILFELPSGFFKVDALKDELSSMLKREVDMVDLNTTGPVLKMQVLKKGVMVFAKDKRIYNRFFVDTVNQYDDLKQTRKDCERNILKGRIYA
ncbi:MAG: hypothetical protein A3J24_04310 [Deltaproteobacteria bacterium RIFCSPLOWO2_02_FULL_53_8]|nr:MAG: hypothetical protein A3J24_04310 [Deltaproteobacteria bacterium RIFCSPLOWO2_02_FULL_53_8]